MRMRKILLISPPWGRLLGANMSACPLGLCYIAAVLEKHGFDVTIYNADFDFKPVKHLGLYTSEMMASYESYLHTLQDMGHPLWKEVESVIAQQSPDIVGISVTTPKYGVALNVSRIVKRLDQNIPVVWGGVHPTILPEQTLKNRDVDIVVRGEGEYTFLDVVRNIDKLNNIPGISYKQGENIVHNRARPLIANLDELPFPARHLLIGKERHPLEAFGHIFASRGCPYHCTFCAAHNVWTRKVRYRSPENVVDEIRHVQGAFKTYRFNFEDDSFTLNKKFVTDVCRLLIKENIDMIWGCETRADLVSDELVRCMKAAGCDTVDIGVESGDEETLERIGKDITIEQILKAKAVLDNNNLDFRALFMIGFPWDTMEKIDKTRALMKELNPIQLILSVVTPYPGTALYDMATSRGLIPHDMDWSTFFDGSLDLCLTENFSREEFSEIVKETDKLVREHDVKKGRELVLHRPLYVIKRVIKSKYYTPGYLWRLFNRRLR